MEFTIIIPCMNEGENVEWITERIRRAIPPASTYEVLFVDDSTDDTPERLKRLEEKYEFVHAVHRAERTGLATAILDGFKIARGQWFIVMDADLQHPPESLPMLIEAMHNDEADIVIPSRFVSGGDDGGLNAWRKFVSWTARMLARGLLYRVRPIKDPTSGYFAVRRETAYSAPLDPIGWKILLELLVRADYEKVAEIPYAFRARDLGHSKFNLQEQWRYVRHLIRLIRSNETDLRFWRFSLVGGSGVIVNMAVYVPLVRLDVPVLLAYCCATMIAIVNNFFWNNRLTWTHIKHDQVWYRMFKFFIISLTGLGISGLAVFLFDRYMGVHDLAAGLFGISVSTVWNFVMNNHWTFGRKSASPDRMSL